MHWHKLPYVAISWNCKQSGVYCVAPADRLLFVINTIKEEIVARVEDSSPRPTNMTDTLEHLIQETLGENHLHRFYSRC